MIITPYYSGASTLGGAQTDPAASLGGYRSATRAACLTALRSNPIPGLRIDWVGGANGAGNGLLKITGTTAQWQPPNDTISAAVDVSAPGAYILNGESTAGKWILVTRTTAQIAASESVQLLATYNNLIGTSDFDVDAPTETHYRCIIMKASAAVTSFKVYLVSGGPCKFGFETLDPTEAATVTADETTAPAGVTFHEANGVGSAKEFGAWSNQSALWIERSMAGLTVDARRETVIHWIANTTEHGELCGLTHIADDSVEGLELYLKATTPPVPGTDAAVATGAALPLSYEAALADGLWYSRIYRRNRFNLLSAFRDQKVLNIVDGVDVGTPPNPPDEIKVMAIGAGKIQVDAVYYAFRDPDPATAWLVYATVGVDPDPATDAPVVTAMLDARGRRQLQWTSGTYEDGDDVRVLVRTRRVDVDSTNTTIYSATAAASAPYAPLITLSQGRAVGLTGLQIASEYKKTWVDQSRNVYIETDLGNAWFYFDTTLLWRVIYDSAQPERSAVYVPSDWSFDDSYAFPTGPPTGYDESAIDCSDTEVWIGPHQISLIPPIDSVRPILKLDITNKLFVCYQQFTPGTLPAISDTVAYKKYGAGTVFFVRDLSTPAMIPYIYAGFQQGVTAYGTHFGVNVNNSHTAEEILAL